MRSFRSFLAESWLDALSDDERDHLAWFMDGDESRRPDAARAIRHAPNFTGIVYRGVPDMGYLHGLPTTVGQTGITDQLLSATKDRSVAMEFVKGVRGVWTEPGFERRSTARAIFTIHLATGADVSAVFPDYEHEVLIRPGTRLRCTSTHVEPTGITVIRLDE